MPNYREIEIKILFIGPYPPPSGGISIHIERLVQLLKSFATCEIIDFSQLKKYNVFNFQEWTPLLVFKKLKKSDLWYIHSGNRTIGKIMVLLAFIFRKKTIVTLHGFGNKLSQQIGFITDRIFCLANMIIVVHADIGKKNGYWNKIKIIEPAFIPPFSLSDSSLPKEINDKIISQKKKGNKILAVNASKNNWGKNGDIYGSDILLQLAEMLCSRKLSYHIILVISAPSINSSSVQQIRISENLTDYMTIFFTDFPFVELIKKSDAVLRPTRADGDALTIREAIYLNKPVFASDVVTRPDGTILFKTGDAYDLLEKLTSDQKYVGQEFKQLHKETYPIEYYREKYLNIIRHACAK